MIIVVNHDKQNILVGKFMINHLIGSQNKIGLEIIKFQVINNSRITQAWVAFNLKGQDQLYRMFSNMQNFD